MTPLTPDPAIPPTGAAPVTAAGKRLRARAMDFAAHVHGEVAMAAALVVVDLIDEELPEIERETAGLRAVHELAHELVQVTTHANVTGIRYADRRDCYARLREAVEAVGEPR